MNRVKQELESENLVACRICLAWEGRLFDIREWGLDQVYEELMGTTLSAWDGLPQHLCAWCRAQLARAQALRARCRRADSLLKQALMHQHFISNSYIRTIDRRAQKLTHPYSNHISKETIDIVFEEIIRTPKDVKDELERDMIVDDDDVDIDDDLFLPNDDMKPFDINFADVSLVKDDDLTDVSPDKSKIIVEEGILPKRTTRKPSKRKKAEEIEIEPPKRKRSQKKTQEKESSVKFVVKKKEKRLKKSKIKREEDYKEFEKKYDFQVKCLTEEEMVEDMERRKLSDKAIKGVVKCQLCYKGFMNNTTLENHMKIAHDPSVGSNECHLCHSRYRFAVNLRQHVQNAHQLMFKCRQCGEIVWGESHAVLHAGIHAGTTLKCRHCDKQFVKKTTRTTHMRMAHPVENAAGGTCEVCGETFTSRRGLRSHKARTHNKQLQPSVPGLFCRKCRVQFESKQALQHHKQQQEGQRCHNDHSACEQCGALYPTEDELIRHKHEAHGVQLFTCDACSKSFLSKVSLSVHIDRVHLHIKPVRPNRPKPAGERRGSKPKPKQKFKLDNMCEICGKAYSCLALLKTHQMRHTGDRPFKCTECPKGFVTATLLREHRDIVHARLRKYRCPECPKTFLHQSSVYVHRAIHTGEKAYECSFCGKAFTQAGTLHTHVKFVHMKVKPPPRKRNKHMDA
ncbi:zinc finger protein ZFP2-like [Cydia pomonella]|uniref:zinc finger protein ZFP2-like n=1 Tax=Cydia pomonella TaxID=82600 RepID=UPI002ADDC005|nr:zinc finger protein ZFP2-like [Cydia pomonella]